MYKLVHKGKLQKRILETEVLQFLKDNPDWILGGKNRKKHSEATKRKISEAHKKVDKSVQIANLKLHQGKTSNPKWKESHSKRFRGRWNITNGVRNKLLPPNKAQKFLESHPDWYRGMDSKRLAVLKDNNDSGRARMGLIESGGILSSKKEMRILRILKSQYEVIHNYIIPHINYAHPYDFYLPEYKLLVEFDGTYWHRNYDPQNDQRAQIAHDRKYKFLIITESAYDNFKSKSRGVLDMIQSIIS